MDLHPTMSQRRAADTIENVNFTRRDMIALGCMGLAAAAFVGTTISLREHTAELTDGQREHLHNLVGRRLDWSEVPASHKNGERFVARTDSGVTIVAEEWHGSHGCYREVNVTHSDLDFLYRCRSGTVQPKDKPVIEALFASLPGGDLSSGYQRGGSTASSDAVSR